jgi:hypothetical protein
MFIQIMVADTSDFAERTFRELLNLNSFAKIESLIVN